jgi:hypothetical protein
VRKQSHADMDRTPIQVAGIKSAVVQS